MRSRCERLCITDVEDESSCNDLPRRRCRHGRPVQLPPLQVTLDEFHVFIPQDLVRLTRKVQSIPISELIFSMSTPVHAKNQSRTSNSRKIRLELLSRTSCILHDRTPEIYSFDLELWSLALRLPFACYFQNSISVLDGPLGLSDRLVLFNHHWGVHWRRGYEDNIGNNRILRGGRGQIFDPGVQDILKGFERDMLDVPGKRGVIDA